MSKLDSILISIAAAERRLQAKSTGLPNKLVVLGIFGGDTPEERREIAMSTALAPYGGISEADAIEAGCKIQYSPMAWLEGRYVDQMDAKSIDRVVNAGKGAMTFDPFAGCIQNDGNVNTNLDMRCDQPHPTSV